MRFSEVCGRKQDLCVTIDFHRQLRQSAYTSQTVHLEQLDCIPKIVFNAPIDTITV